MSSYFRPQDQLLPKTARMVSEATRVDYILTESEIDAFLLEANWIRKLQPKYNSAGKDGKTYPFLEITIKDPVPQIRIVHQEANPKARYFGPYPTGSDLTSLLRFLRPIFPYVSQNHPQGKACLRSHLGLCPCPDVYSSKAAQKNYRHNLRNMIDFLSGKRQSVQKKLLTEMTNYSQNQNYEQAGLIKNQLSRLDYITQPRTRAWEYEVNPNLTQDRLTEETRALARILDLPKIGKLEAYDISNTGGRQATGAQVVFIDGLPAKNLYRHYKIKLNPPVGGSNDFAMLAEVIRRRLHSDIPLPDVLVIDGGRGQLAAVKTVFTGHQQPKIIALAKRQETIFTDDGNEINLSDNSPALHLLQKIRDEAHRFSRRYHFFLRKQKMLE